METFSGSTPQPSEPRSASATITSDQATDSAEPISATTAEQGFSRSILISGIRCTLTYVILPFVAPWIGLADSVGPGLGLTIGTVALVANVFSIRRFWVADHPWKRPITVLHVGVIILLLVLGYLDIVALLQ